MQRSLASLLVVALVLTSTVPAAGQEVVGRPEIELSTADAPVVPGQETTIDVAVSNSGQITHNGPNAAEERVTTARGATMTVKSGGTPIDVKTGTVALGSVPVGVTKTPIRVEIGENVTPGTYRLPVTLKYDYTRLVDLDPGEQQNHEFERTERKHITVRVENRAQFRVVDHESDVLVGDRGSLSLTVENVGTRTAYDASLRVQSRSDEVTFGTGSASSTGYVGTVAPGERTTVDYDAAVADNATVRNYTLDATATFEDGQGISRTSKTLLTSLRPRPEQRLGLEDVDASLGIGREGTFTGTVVNRGPEPISNPVVVFNPTDANVNVDQTEYAIDDLAVGERDTFSFTVDVSDAASESVQQFDLRVRYRNPEGDRRVSEQLDARAELLERGDRFAVEPVDATVATGATTRYRLVVTNNGDETLTNVQGKAFLDAPLSSDDDTVFVSRLEPGESTEVVVGLQLAGDALPKTYSFTVDFQYDLPDGDTELSESYRVPVSATEPEQGGQSLPLGVGVAVLAVALGAAVVWWRRTRGQ
ncbi:MAG: sialidase [Haloferacaceae archaeon]